MDNAKRWEKRWSAEEFSPKWAHRGVSREIIDAINAGWLPPTGPVLDIGCGLGDIAAWFGKNGYQALGFDMAASAIARAREMHAPLPPTLEFMNLNACSSEIPNRQYRILIDRGCLHAIPPPLVVNFTRNIASVAAPDARMLLFMRAFRHGRPFGDQWETNLHLTFVTNAYAGKFKVERYAPTYMDAHGGARAETALPGLAFWLTASKGGGGVRPMR